MTYGLLLTVTGVLLAVYSSASGDHQFDWVSGVACGAGYVLLGNALDRRAS